MSVAGTGKVRKFLDGNEHGIFGVPVVQPAPEVVAAPPKGMTPHEQMLWQVRSRLLKAESGQEFKLVR
ncbi:hypothetical protein IE4872_CH01096 [Rhizobium gallicum]|uniref:Uncharacterized protein n=1 Tax=Rhizobium gallicum TaxID=56730 RepID=A0A1L5NFR7_9HYPH|nr:hypothetical protein [Rhizobium gallicum]APO66747.1 hypothetical protein IE4872_CH01096 [Rhizobium gallicum]